ncbi:collagen alpha-1(III) chain-like [Bos indicus x Bos taurus]|uniref:collagen alpha-1(III) chain-like n=1 Tax=Bos indicus x Bos taurus TaxID=30522 RepID=UPI000F7D1E3A|nr:collagen alpha-1(III) chain-like [Bos indicus x Bos taurus]
MRKTVFAVKEDTVCLSGAFVVHGPLSSRSTGSRVPELGTLLPEPDAREEGSAARSATWPDGPRPPFGARARPRALPPGDPRGSRRLRGARQAGLEGAGWAGGWGPRAPVREAEARLRAGESLDVGNSLPARPAERRGHAGAGRGHPGSPCGGRLARPPPALRCLPGHSRRPGGLPPGRASLPSAAIRPPLTRHPALLPRGAARGSPSPAASGRCVGREPRRGLAGESGARRPPRRSRRESGRERGSRGGVCARVCERESEGERGSERAGARESSGGDSENAAPAGQERRAAPSRRRPPGRDPEAGEPRPPPPDRAPPPPPGAGLSVPPSAASQEPPGGGAPPASNRRCTRRERPQEGRRLPPRLAAFPGDPESEI